MPTIPKASLPLGEVIERLRSDPRYAENIVTWRTLPPKDAEFTGYPDWGEFTPDDRGEADLAWIAYIVAEK